MNNLNSILIEGNIVRDVEVRSTPKGTSTCTFTIATNRFFKQETGMEKEVSYFKVETWAKLAEIAGNSGQKGRAVKVVGRLRQDRWQGTDGKPQSKVIIVADHLEFKPIRKEAPTEIDAAVSSF